MRKIIVILITITAFGSCKKYEEGPTISLRTKKSRLSGKWVGVHSTNPVYKNLIENKGSIIFEFDKNGDVTKSISGLVTLPSYYLQTFNTNGVIVLNQKGIWSFYNKKNGVVLSLYGYNSENYEIEKLTKNELILEDEQNDKWYFEKK